MQRNVIFVKNIKKMKEESEFPFYSFAKQLNFD